MNNKSMILAGSLAILLCFVAVGWWILSPAWVLLFPHPLYEKAQQNVLLLLNQHNVEYKLDSVKNTILVKSSSLKKAQIMLAENGQPEEQIPGLEVFNSSDYGLSEFAQNVNYQRGMEEELARTIKKLKGVKSVRVHLTIKKDTLFDDRKQPPKATVVIKMESDEALNARSVQGIQEIVAAAVPNLEPQRVIIVTDAGQVLSASDKDEVKDTSGAEGKFTSQISYLLEGILNNDDFKVSVNVVMDYKKKVTIEENYLPNKNTGQGFLAKRKSIERSGLDSAQSTAPQSNRNEEEEYLFSKERSEITYATGEIKKITVGVVIRESMTDDEQSKIEKLIFNTLGMVDSRGDKVSVFINKKSEPSEIVTAPINQEHEQNKAVSDLSITDSFFITHKILILISFIVLLISFCLSLALTVRNRATSEKKALLSEDEVRALTTELKTWVCSS